MEDTTIKINIESRLINLPLLRKTVRGICSCVIEDEKIFQDIDLCLNEALSNVINYAYQNEPGHEIEIVVNLYPKEFVFQIIDKGKQGDSEPTIPEINQNPQVDDIESISESGRGLFLINQLMDEVTYKSEKGKNILIMRKRF